MVSEGATLAGTTVEGLNPPSKCCHAETRQSSGVYALRFKCPDQSRAPGRKSQFRLEPDKTFSAHFWEVEQAGFRELPSKGSGGGGPRPLPVLPDTELLLASGSHTPIATPALLFGGCHGAVPAQPCRGG